MKVAVLTILAVLVSVLLLGIRVLFVKGGRFPDGHIGHSAAMRRRGISCAHGDEASASGASSHRYNAKNQQYNQ